MQSKLALLCLGVVFLVAISDARPAGDSNGGDGAPHHHHHHTEHTHHHHTSGGGGGDGGAGDGGAGDGGAGGDGDNGKRHVHHHKGEPHVHHYSREGPSHHHRREGSSGDDAPAPSGGDDGGSPSGSPSPSGGDGGGSPSGSLSGNLNVPDVGSLSGKLNGGGDGGDGGAGGSGLGGLTGDLTGNLPTGALSGGDLNVGGGGGDDSDSSDQSPGPIETGDGGLTRDGKGGLRVPGFGDPRGENVSRDGGTPPQDLVQRLKAAGIDLSGISPDVLKKLASHTYGHLGVDSTAPRDCMDEYYFNDGVLKHFVRGTRDAGDALLSGLHDVIANAVGNVGQLKNLDDGLLRGLQQVLCGAENGFSDFADDFDSATHIAKHGLIDIFKLQGDGLLAFPEGILGIAEEAAQAIGSAATDGASAIGRGFDTLEEHFKTGHGGPQGE